jgi:hypothetical protein
MYMEMEATATYSQAKHYMGDVSDKFKATILERK